MRVLVFGVDGLTFRVLKPMMERNLLPNFQRLSDQGVEAILKSTVPPMTPPAWMSIATGLPPAGHGVYDFWDCEYTEQGPRANIITHRKGGQAIWNILSEWGKRVIVANVPLTYPPEPVNGIMLSGYMAPDMRASVTYPQSFKAELLREVPRYQIDLAPAVAGEQVGDTLTEVNKITRERIAMFRLLLERPWDFFFIAFVGADRIQHVRWDDILAFHPQAVQYYQMLDEALGSALDALQPDDLLMVVSDHGFQGARRNFYIHEYLYRQGLLQMRDQWMRRRAEWSGGIVALLWAMGLRGVPSKIRRQLHRLGVLERAQELHAVALPDLDWSRTLAWLPSPSGAIAGYADIFIDDAMPEEQLNALQANLLALTDPETGQPLALEVYREDAFGTGPFAPRERHLILISGENTTPLPELGVRSLWCTRKTSSGVHHPDGVLYLYGSRVKQEVTLASAHVYDVVPTILSYMDIPLPATLVGKALGEAFQTHLSQELSHEPENIVGQKLRKLASRE